MSEAPEAAPGGVHAALLAAVLAAPDDDEPRLVLADFYLQRGNPRGELILDQCALVRRGLSPARRARAKARTAALLAEHGRAWSQAAAAAGGQCTFRRGFVHAVDAAAAVFLSAGRTLIDTEPVARLVLRGATARTAQSLADSDLLARVQQLTLVGDIGDEGAQALASSPSLRRLRRLNLRSNGIGPAGARALAASATLRLEMLGLNGNDIGDEGAHALADAPLLDGVRELYLARAGVGDRGVAALAGSARAGSLRVLGLTGNHAITDDGARALAASTALRALEQLELELCPDVGDDSVAALRRRWRVRAGESC